MEGDVEGRGSREKDTRERRKCEMERDMKEDNGEKDESEEIRAQRAFGRYGLRQSLWGDVREREMQQNT